MPKKRLNVVVKIVSREDLSNPHRNTSVSERVEKLKTNSDSSNREWVDLGNGFSKLVPKNPSKQLK